MEEFDLNPNEHVVAQVREHLFVLALKLIPFAVLFFLPFLFGNVVSILSMAVPELAAVTGSLNMIGSAPLRFLTGAWWLFLWMAAFTIFMKFYLTVWIITNMRIVKITQFGFFSREVSSFLLLRVQDITTEIHGILATLIGFGELIVQTAGSDESFSMPTIARPKEVRDLIMDQVAALHHEPRDLSGV